MSVFDNNINTDVYKIINNFRKAYPDYANLSDAEILTIMNTQLDSIKINDDEQISAFWNNNQNFSAFKIDKKSSEKPIEIKNLNKITEQRLRAVSSALKKAESKNGFIGNAWSGFKNFTGIGDSSDKVLEKLKHEKVLLSQFNPGTKKGREIFKELTGEEYSEENLTKFINGEIKLKSEQALAGYTEGQDMACDIAGDLVSGIAAVGLYSLVVAAAPVTGGLSLAAATMTGAGLAIAGGGAIKTGIKYADAKSGGREYDSNQRDFITGAFSGLLAPITAGLGGAIGKTVATKLGIEVFKQGTKQGINIGLKPLASASRTFNGGIKEGLKNAVLNPAGYSYGGTLGKQVLAYGTEMASDGALGGSVDTAFRTAYDGGEADEVFLAGLEGGIGGLFLAPILGGSMKLAGKSGHYIGKKLSGANEPEEMIPVKELDKFKKFEQSGKYKNLKLSDAKIKKINSILNNNKTSGVLKKLKSTTKRQTVKQGEPRFNQNELINILNKTKNNYLKENQDISIELVREMAEMHSPYSANMLLKNLKNFGDFYCFQDDEIVEILKIVDKKNIDTLKLMLKSRDNNNKYTYYRYSFKELFELYSHSDTDVAAKVIKMVESDQSTANNVSAIRNCLSLVKEYPEEMNFLTDNFNPKLAGKILSGEPSDITNLVKRIKTCSREEKNLIEILLSPQCPGGYINAEILLKILEADTGLNNKQIITFCKLTNADYGGEEYSKVLNKFSGLKGKEFVFSDNTVYKKSPPMTKDDIFKTIRATGLSEDDSRAFCNLEIAEGMIKLFELDEISENMIFGGMPKALLIKGVMNLLKNNANSEMLEPLKAIKSITGYISKENFEIFKMRNKDGTFEQFATDLGSNITNTECQNICSIVNKLTGRTIYENDLHALNSDMLKLINLKESEVSEALKKLNDLDLISDDSNIMTLLTKTEELSKIKITPEIKKFAKELSGNKFIEEGSVIDILHAIQSENSNIVKTKISYSKELLENTDVIQTAIPNILKNLSSQNEELLNRQILLLKNIKSPDDMSVYSKFIKAESVKEFDIYKNLIKILEEKAEITKIHILHSVMSFQKNKLKVEVADFITTVLNKNTEVAEISALIDDIIRLDEGAQKEFMKLYLKGLDVDLGSLKNSFNEIILAHISDIKNMNIKEKLLLYEKLSGIDESGKTTIKQLGLNYNELLDKIINSIGVKRQLVSLNPEQKNQFLKHIIANNNPKAEKILKEFDFAGFGKEGLPLKYTRDSFNSNVEALLKDLPEEEVNVILKHFGLVKGEAGFDGLPNNAVFDNLTVSKEGQTAAQKIKTEIESFLLNNEVLLPDYETGKILDGLIKGLPEFTSIIGKKQHGTHDYSVDIHTLKVLQSAMNDPLYKTLSDTDKTIIKYAILLHDFGKKGGVVDMGHASLSADYAWSILDRYSFPAGVKDRIIDIVDNHHWFEQYNTGNASAENIAVRCRKPEDLKIYEIFAKADLENVNSEFHLERTGVKTTEEFHLFMKNKFEALENAVNNIYKKANIIFDSQFMHMGKLFPTEEIELNGIKKQFRVLNFSKLADGENLEKYGFAPGVTRENARFVVHMTEPNYSNLETVFRLTETPVFQSTWSSSLVQMSNNTTYWGKNFGVVFEIPQANYSEAFWGNTHSGGEKGLDAFQNFLFSSRKIKKEDINGKCKTWDVRHYVRDNFIKEMTEMGYNLNETEYAQLSQYLFGKKYISQIRKDIQIGDKVISSEDLVSALEKSRDELFYGDEHSEIIPINPKIKGIFAKTGNLEDCPEELLNFAHEHNLPIILMKPAKPKKTDKINKNVANLISKNLNKKP